MKKMNKIQDELGEIKPFVINKKMILAIDEGWNDYFNPENSTFKAIIQNGKYVLVGPKVNRSGPTPNPTTNEDDTSE